MRFLFPEQVSELVPAKLVRVLLAEQLVFHALQLTGLRLRPHLDIVRGQILLESLVVLVTLRDGIPHLQESDRKALHRVTFKLQARVLPEPERLRPVKIFISQVISTRKTDNSVNDRDLAVVAVVEEQIQPRNKGVKDTALDPQRLRPGDKIRINETKAPHIIVEDADLNTGLHPVHKDVPKLMPALGILNGVILHENKLLRLRELFLLRFEPLLRVIVIRDLRVLINRILSLRADIIDYAAKMPAA